MTNSAVISSDNDSVISEIEIAAPPARVFSALVEREQALQWGGGETHQIIFWEMDARPGGSWRYIAKERKHTGTEFDHHGEIIQIDPPRLLEYSWFANWHPDPAQPTIVRWDLTPTATGTRLKVTHRGLGSMKGLAQGYSQGWPGLIEQIKKFVEK
jgi:uncharacterized protein YndB with AHSA1/START domain